MSERSDSTKKGQRAEALIRAAVKGRKGICDIHTDLGGFEIRWGPTTKNSHGLAADRKRASENGGYCVQVAGAIPPAMRRHGDRSLYEFLVHHSVEDALSVAREIREKAQAGEGTNGDGDGQMRLA